MKKLVILPILIAAISLTSCSSAKKSSSQSAKNNAQAEAATLQSSTLASGEDAVQTSAPNSSWRSETRSDRFNSKIKVSFDAFGNKTESRYFASDRRLSSLEMLTKTNGGKEILIYGLDGSFRNLPSDSAIDVLTASPDEIADKVGIREPEKFVTLPPQTIAKIEPVQTESTIVSTPPEQPSTEEAKPVETNKTEPATQAQPSPVQQAKQAAKESENKDNLKQ